MERIKLDLVPSCIKPVLHASQYDDGRQWQCDILNGGTPYVFQNGDTVELNLRKGDGLVVTSAVAVVPGQSYVILVSTEQMCAIYGSNLGELKLKSNGVDIGSCNFILEVEKDTTGGDKKSVSQIYDLPSQVDRCVQAELETVGAKLTGYDNTESGLDATNVQDALDELASQPSVDAYTKQESDAFITDEYDATSTYAVGDMVIHENALYVCSTAITTAEAWNSAHWTLTDIATAIGTVKSAIPTKTSDLQNDSGFAQIDDAEESASKTWSSEKIEAGLDTKASAEEVNYMVEEETDLKSSTAFTFYPDSSGNVYNGNNVRIETNSNYDSYLLILSKDCKIYFGGTLPAYVAICYGTPPVTKEPDRLRWACTSGTRYRNLDSNLPLENTPLSVVKNGIIVITVTKGATVSLYGLGLAYKFTDNAKTQIIDTVNIKKPLVTADTTANGYVTERMYINLPSKVGYVQYDFAHYVNNSINADTWNIRITNAVDDDLTQRYLLTTTGEYECAIKIDGAPDFMGGISHGSEIVTDCKILLDGKVTALASIGENTAFNELRVVVISKLYNPNDETTIVAEHSKEYIFNENGLTINQLVNTFSYSLTFTIILCVMHCSSLQFCHILFNWLLQSWQL